MKADLKPKEQEKKPKTPVLRRPDLEPVVLRKPDVAARIGLSVPTMERRVRAGRFPKPINLGGRAVGWLTDEIDAWLQAQAEKRT